MRQRGPKASIQVGKRHAKCGQVMTEDTVAVYEYPHGTHRHCRICGSARRLAKGMKPRVLKNRKPRPLERTPSTWTRHR